MATGKFALGSSEALG
jgi:hypothetical protein